MQYHCSKHAAQFWLVAASLLCHNYTYWISLNASQHEATEHFVVGDEVFICLPGNLCAMLLSPCLKHDQAVQVISWHCWWTRLLPLLRSKTRWRSGSFERKTHKKVDLWLHIPIRAHGEDVDWGISTPRVPQNTYSVCSLSTVNELSWTESSVVHCI